MATILEVQDLIKHFPTVKAVNGVSFQIEEGRCFGLLGPNGAGKTTTVEIIEGIKKPTSGRILYRGEPIGPQFKQEVGIQFQSTAIQDYLTVKEAIKLFWEFYEKPLSVDKVVQMCRLEDILDRDTRKLSGGQRQRVLLAIALINDPKILFLDEPTTGLDPQARRNFWALIQEIKSRGKTVVLTTHYMEEAYLLCDEIIIMDHGKIIAQGEPDTLLKDRFEGSYIQIPIEDLGREVDTLPWKAFVRDNMVEIETNAVADTIRTLLEWNVPLRNLQVRSSTLEDLFLDLTGRDLRN